jgi:hypothetical protein
MFSTTKFVEYHKRNRTRERDLECWHSRWRSWILEDLRRKESKAA